MGKLNILHHKEWHVYTKANRDKVKKDEENATRQEQKLQTRVDQYEREARLMDMRQRADDRRKAEGIEKEPEIAKHVNLFEEEEKHEHSRIELSDKQLEQKKWEDKHTWYLGETRDGKKDTPWYTTEDYGKLLRTPVDETKRMKKQRLEDIRKNNEDPLNYIKKISKPKEKISKPTKQSSVPSSSKSIEQLRKERLERELGERNRIRKEVDPGSEKGKRHETDSKFYHSQFNPNKNDATKKLW